MIVLGHAHKGVNGRFPRRESSAEQKVPRIGDNDAGVALARGTTDFTVPAVAAPLVRIIIRDVIPESVDHSLDPVVAAVQRFPELRAFGRVCLGFRRACFFLCGLFRFGGCLRLFLGCPRF